MLYRIGMRDGISDLKWPLDRKAEFKHRPSRGVLTILLCTESLGYLLGHYESAAMQCGTDDCERRWQ